MKHTFRNTAIWASTVALALFFAASGQGRAQTQNPTPAPNPAPNQGQPMHGHKFVDLNGDGINDNAPDADHDGIPNGQDPDYTGPRGRGFIDENGDGINDRSQDFDNDGVRNGVDPDWLATHKDVFPNLKGARGMRGHGLGFIDENGDGINDNAQDFDHDGIPNGQDPDWVRPMNGTGRMMGKKGMRQGRGFRGGHSPVGSKPGENSPGAGNHAGGNAQSGSGRP